MTNQGLLRQLSQSGVLHSPRLLAALRTTDRQFFVPVAQRRHCYDDRPLPIGYGATISQPTTVVMMLEMLHPQPGERCLDIGAGSGWTAALLSALTEPTGYVVAVERQPELAARARRTLQQRQCSRIEIVVADGYVGYQLLAPYDCIHVAAAVEHVPTTLVQQLRIGGRIVIPVGREGQDLVRIDKISDTTVQEYHLPGFQFIPLVHDEAEGSKKYR